MSKPKFNVGDKVVVKATGRIMRVAYYVDGTYHTWKTHGSDVRGAYKATELVSYADHVQQRYLAGVDKAKADAAARSQRINDRFAMMRDSVAQALQPSLAEAKQRAAARLAKYGAPQTTIRRILVVPKGSVPRRGSWDAYFAEVDAKEASGDGE